MRGPCMCGDIRCPSCGPAQGNWKCVVCGTWADKGCEHVDEETGQYKPEAAQAVATAINADKEFWAKHQKDMERLDALHPEESEPTIDWDTITE